MSEVAVTTTGVPTQRPYWRPGAVWLMFPGLLFLAVFLLYPSAQMLGISFRDPSSGELTLAAFAKVFGGGLYTRTLFSTFGTALQTTACCLLFGYPLAYWLARQGRKRQRITMMFVLLPFWTSALVKNFAWLVLLARNGFVGNVFEWFGIPGSRLLFNHSTVVFAMAHTMLPLAVIVMLPVMNQVERQLLSAAGTLGASPAQIFWRVFFPLSMPGVAAAGVLVFIASLGFFITPQLVGGARETMLGQLIIMQIQQLQNWQLGAAIATMLVLAALVTCFIYDRVFGLSTLSGGGSDGTRRSNGAVRRLGLALTRTLGNVSDALMRGSHRVVGEARFGWLLPAFCWTLIAVLILPILAFIPMAFTESTFLSFPPQGFSTAWFTSYFQSPLWMAATVRSFGIGAATAIVTVGIATLAALGLARSRSRLAGLAFLLFITPMIMPPVVISIALFFLFAKIGLIASNLGIIIGHTVIALPMAFVIVLATFKHYDWRLDQAAATLGASPFEVFRLITLPLIKGGVFAGLITAFLQSFEELTVAMFIGGGLKTTLPKQMWDDILLQVTPTLAAASVVVLLVIACLFSVLELLRPAEPIKGNNG